MVTSGLPVVYVSNIIYCTLQSAVVRFVIRIAVRFVILIAIRFAMPLAIDGKKGYLQLLMYIYIS